MTTKKKDILNQLSDLREYTDTNKNLVIGESWKAELKQIVKTYIDENSHFITQIDKLRFTVIHAGKPTPGEFLEQYNLAKHDASTLVFHISNFIEKNGLKKQGNFLTRLSEGWAIAAITIGASSLFALGVWFTQNKIDIEKIELKNKIDSLSTVPTLTKPNSIPNLDTNKTVITKSNIHK